MHTYRKYDTWKGKELHNAANKLNELLNNKKLPDIDAEAVNIIAELLTEYAHFNTHEDLKNALMNVVKDLGFIIDKLNNYEIMHTYKPDDYWKGAEVRAADRMIREVANYKEMYNEDKKILLTIAELFNGYYEFKTHEDLKNQLIKTFKDFQNII